MPSEWDYLAVFTGLPGVLAGSWTRLGNVVRAYAFSEYCELVPEEGAQPTPAPGPSVPQICGSDPTQYGIFHWFTVAPGYREVHMRWLEYTVGGVVTTWPSSRFVFGVSSVQPAVGDNGPVWSQRDTYWNPVPNPTGLVLTWPEDRLATVYVGIWNEGGLAINECVRFNYDLLPYEAQPTAYTPPALPSPPAGIIAAPGCPTITDLQDLGNELCKLADAITAIDRKVDDLLDSSVPPEYTADQSDTAVADLDAPIIKPSTAIGIAITLSLPAGIGRYGRNPGAFPGAGHVVLGTADGWLPSVPLKHNPQLVLPLPFQVTELGLDLAPGVGASYRWLWPGRPVG